MVTKIGIMGVFYFDQLSNAVRTQNLVKKIFELFSTFFVHLKPLRLLDDAIIRGSTQGSLLYILIWCQEQQFYLLSLGILSKALFLLFVLHQNCKDNNLYAEKLGFKNSIKVRNFPKTNV